MPPNNYPATSTDGTFLTPPDLMNASTAMGPAQSLVIRRHFDWFVELNNVVACTASPGSLNDNHSVSGNAYNSIVVDRPWPRSENFTGAQWNDHGSPRYKPDIVAWSNGGASSFATPQVCSMAAVLMERANVDSHMADAQNSEVIKTILMAGATRFSYLLSTDWDDYTSAAFPHAVSAKGSYRELFGEDALVKGEWERESDTQPTSYKYGAGALHALGAYRILDADQFGDTSLIAWSSLVSSDYSENVGWDFHEQPANSNSTSTAHYYFSFDEKSMFSVVMNWHRRIAPHPDGYNYAQSHLADYELTFYDSNNNRVANSDNTTSNVELIEVEVDAGGYRLEVEVKTANADTGMDYALAWTTKEVLEPPSNFVIVDDPSTSTTIVMWNAGASGPDEHKFRFQVSDDDFATLDEDVWVKDASYTIASPGLDGRNIRISTYPDDDEVAYLYPSESVQIDDPAAESVLTLHRNASTDTTEGWKIYHVLHEANLSVARVGIELGSAYNDEISRVVVAAGHMTILSKHADHFGTFYSLYGAGDYDLADLGGGALDDEFTSWWLLDTPSVVLEANAESDPTGDGLLHYEAVDVPSVEESCGQNDFISSIRIQDGWTLEIFEHEDYGGLTATYTGPQLVTQATLSGLGLDDAISSYKFYPTPNTAPVAVDDTVTTNEDVAVTVDVVINDTDVDGDTLFVDSVGVASDGSVTVSSGSVVYTPNANFNGTDSFDYTVSDGTDTDTGTVTVTVRPAKPTGLAATAGNGQATLTWDDPSNSSITGYEYFLHAQIAKLIPSDGAASDNFGNSVAVDGDTMVAGAPGDGNDTGAAYVFVRQSGAWSRVAKLTAYNGGGGDAFGKSVAMDGDTVVVGATGDDDNGSNSGAAYVFTKPSSGGWATTTETAKLTASDGAIEDGFGYSVAVEGDTVVVSAYGDDDNGGGSGSAYVFTKPATGWTSTSTAAKLTASDGAGGDRFGKSAAVDGDTVVLGAHWDDDNGSKSGSAYLFSKPASGGWAATNETAKLTASDGDADDRFGTSVAVDGETVAVGAWVDDDNGPYSGSVYVYNKPGNGSWVTATEGAKLIASDGASGDWFGGSVSLDGDRMVVGASGDDDNGSRSGSVYVYERQYGAWSRIAKLKASDGAIDDEFGISVAVDGDAAVVGAHWDDDNGSKSGSAYVHAVPDWTAIPNSAVGEDNATSYTVTSLTNGVNYRFKIRATNSVVTGAPSTTVTVTPTN